MVKLTICEKEFNEHRSYRKIAKLQRKNKNALRKKRNKKIIRSKKEKLLFKEDPIYTFLIDKNFPQKYKYKSVRKRSKNIREGEIVIPETFCFFDNTDETIVVLREIMYLSLNEKLEGIHVNHKSTKKMSLCASTVLTVIILSIVRKADVLKKRNMISSVMSNKDNLDVVEMIKASGLIKSLNDISDIDEESSDKLITLDLITSDKNKLITNKKFHSTADEVAKEVIDYFSKCLNTQNYELNTDGENFFKKIIGEVIDNCNLHSEVKDSWFCIGYAKLDDEYTNCKLVIFNFGDTIYESLRNNSIDSDIPDKLCSIYKGMNTKYFTEENIFTYLALQDGVSRFYSDKNFEDERVSTDRGTGTINMLKQFYKIGHTSCGKVPKMIILSGKTKIVFDSKYSLKKQQINQSMRDLIVFNTTNDLYEVPDKNNVINNKEHFPGTLISMEFYLEEKFLKSL